MAIFGRKTARQRMKRATQQALSIPTFRTTADCTPLVLGGLWPTELRHVTSETASLAEHLDRDLQRIASSANDKLRAIGEAGFTEPVRQAEETRVINVARAFAVLRVESTVRHLRKEPLGFPPEYFSLGAVAQPSTRAPIPVQDRQVEIPRATHDGHRRSAVRDGTAHEPPAPKFVPSEEAEIGLAPETPGGHEFGNAAERDSTAGREPEVIDANTARSATPPEPMQIESITEVEMPQRSPESAECRLRRLVQYVARQEPGLKWAVGQREDGAEVLVTDLAHGWIPPGIGLPAGIALLEPARRGGNTAALLGPTVLSATYTPGDPFVDARQFGPTSAATSIRRAEPVEDLGWQLIEATHWRDGLPRLVHTMAKAAAAGTGVVEAELDVLRVHLDTARYQLISRYPDPDPAVLLNCLLLAATEAMARADHLTANYHFAWFQALSAPQASSWSDQT